MKVAGALTLVAGILATLVLSLWPVQVSVLGTDFSCGPPVVRVIAEPIEDSVVEQECVNQSAIRLVVGVAVGLIAGSGGLIMLLTGPSSLNERDRRELDEWRQWRSRQQP